LAAEIATAIDSRNRRLSASPPHIRDNQAFLNEDWYVGRQRNVWAMLGCVQIYCPASCLVVLTIALVIKLRIIG
jgi:hypothetical protein